eukprot:277668-Ditylum_brightwellii.AAC.1
MVVGCCLIGKSGYYYIHAGSLVPQRTLLAAVEHYQIHVRSLVFQKTLLPRRRYCRARMVDCCLIEKSGYYHIHARSLNPTNDIASKEEILQSKNVGFLFSREVRALPHSCNKPGFPKDITSKEEILQTKKSGLLFIREVRTLPYSCEKP